MTDTKVSMSSAQSEHRLLLPVRMQTHSTCHNLGAAVCAHSVCVFVYFLKGRSVHQQHQAPQVYR